MARRLPIQEYLPQRQSHILNIDHVVTPPEPYLAPYLSPYLGPYLGLYLGPDLSSRSTLW